MQMGWKLRGRLRGLSAVGAIAIASILVALAVSGGFAAPSEGVDGSSGGFAAASGGVEESSRMRTFDFLIGAGFLCNLDPKACPDISMAENGDTVEISGAGTFTLHAKSVTGGGSFVHKDKDGNVLASGVWFAVKVESFKSFGSGSAQGLPPELFGGRLVLKIRLVPAGGPEHGIPGVLRVSCALGNKIPPNAIEGIRLHVHHGPNFNTEVTGFTVFVRT